jgi:hypothetical protein
VAASARPVAVEPSKVLTREEATDLRRLGCDLSTSWGAPWFPFMGGL